MKRIYTFRAQRHHTCLAVILPERFRRIIYLYPFWPFVWVLKARKRS